MREERKEECQNICRYGWKGFSLYINVKVISGSISRAELEYASNRKF